MSGALWSWGCLVGLWGFLLATFGFILQGFPARGVFDGRRALRWGVALVCFFVLWMVAMARA